MTSFRVCSQGAAATPPQQIASASTAAHQDRTTAASSDASGTVSIHAGLDRTRARGNARAP